MKVFVDDIRVVKGFDYIAKTAEDFYAYIRNHEITHIELLSLDHDLGDSHALTGYDIVKALPELGVSIGRIQFHTANPVGFENMVYYAINLKKHKIVKIDKIVTQRLDSRHFNWHFIVNVL